MRTQHLENARIPSESVVIEGTLRVPASPVGVVLFAHGSGSSRFSSRNSFVADVLHGAHIGTLLIDLLTPDEDREYRNRFNIELLTRRLDDASRWLTQQAETKLLPLGLFGASTGAAAALQLGAERGSEISAIVSRGGRPDLAEPRQLSKVSAPTLLIVGGLDEVVIELNKLAFQSLQCEKRLSIVDGATHLFEEPGALEEVASLSADWFLRYFPSHGRGADVAGGPA